MYTYTPEAACRLKTTLAFICQNQSIIQQTNSGQGTLSDMSINTE